MQVEYQLDNCLNVKRLCKVCVLEGLVRMYRFDALSVPVTQGDVLIVEQCHSLSRVLLTKDCRLPVKHEKEIQEPHHGVVMVNTTKGRSPRTEDVLKALEAFKSAYPEWSKIVPHNSIIHITEKWVEVSRIVSGMLKLQTHLSYADPECASTFRATIFANGATSIEDAA